MPDTLNTPTAKHLNEVQRSVLGFVETKIGVLEHQRERLRKLLEKTDSSLSGFQEYRNDILGVSPAQVPEASPTTATQPEHTHSGALHSGASQPIQPEQEQDDLQEGESFNPLWLTSQKILFVVSNPGKYGVTTFVGAPGITDAILQEQPDWLTVEPRNSIIAKVGPVVSKLIGKNRLVKLRKKGTKKEFHFIDKKWFQADGSVKPEYKELISDLEQVPENELAPVPAGANGEVTERNGGHPSMDAAGTQKGLISLNGHPNPTIFE